MSRVLLNLTIDSVAAALLTAMVGTGYILAFALPPGTNRTHVLWGLLRHQWGAVHFWISVALLAVLAVHVALHWRWLVTGLTRRFGLEAWAARSPRLATLSVLATAGLPLTILAVAAHVSVRPMETPLHPLADGWGAPDAPPERRAAGPDPTSSLAAAVLRERCAACHGERDPAAGVRADTPAALEQVQAGVRWIVPGDPGRSRLFEVVGVPSTTRAIAPRHRLSEAESDALRAWVASLDGAARRDSSWSRIACARGRGMVAPGRTHPPRAESRRRAQLRARSAVDRGTDVAPWRRAAHRGPDDEERDRHRWRTEREIALERARWNNHERPGRTSMKSRKYEQPRRKDVHVASPKWAERQHAKPGAGIKRARAAMAKKRRTS